MSPESQTVRCSLANSSNRKKEFGRFERKYMCMHMF